MQVIHELDICGFCAVLIANGDGSGDPERAQLAHDAALGVWGDDLRHLSMSCDHEEDGCSTDMFRCDYCREDVFEDHHRGVILR